MAENGITVQASQLRGSSPTFSAELKALVLATVTATATTLSTIWVLRRYFRGLLDLQAQDSKTLHNIAMSVSGVKLSVSPSKPIPRPIVPAWSAR